MRPESDPVWKLHLADRLLTLNNKIRGKKLVTAILGGTFYVLVTGAIRITQGAVKGAETLIVGTLEGIADEIVSFIDFVGRVLGDVWSQQLAGLELFSLPVMVVTLLITYWVVNWGVRYVAGE